MAGLDISEHMLRLAETRRATRPAGVAGRVRFRQGDMARFELDERFGLVFSAFRGFQALTTLRVDEDELELRWTYRFEMHHLLELCGFEIEAEYSDYEGSPPAYGREQIWVARRR